MNLALDSLKRLGLSRYSHNNLIIFSNSTNGFQNYSSLEEKGNFFVLKRQIFRRFSSSISEECYSILKSSNRSLQSNFRKKFKSIINLQYPRQMSTSKDELILREKYQPRDVSFTTPYGKIAALEWGQKESPNKILCAHGWLDNAGSFERLVPFILDHENNAKLYHIVSLDLPGVGFSSHRPAGSEYTTLSFVMEMRRVAQLLGWDKLTLLSHSLGAHLSYLYACVYPHQVTNMISIDLAHPITRQVNNWHLSIANSIEDQFKCEFHYQDDPTTNIRVPVYNQHEALQRLMDGHSSSLSRESAEVLLKRGAKKHALGYTFSRDIRLRHLSVEIRPDDDMMFKLLDEPFKPNLLILRATRSPYHRPEEIRLKYYQLFQKNCPLFRDVMLEGTHHLHMNNPETVAPEICKFLNEVQSIRRNVPLSPGKL